MPCHKVRLGATRENHAGPLGDVIAPVMSVQVSSSPAHAHALRGRGGATSEGCDGKGAPGRRGHWQRGWSTVVRTGDTAQLRGEGGGRRKLCLVL